MPWAKLKSFILRKKGVEDQPKTLGEHLRNRRLALGLRQRDAAQRLGVMREVYDRWERNERKPVVSIWPSIIAFLGYIVTLLKAPKFNPWCAIYLIRLDRHFDDGLPDSSSPGSEEEARLFVEYQSAAWVGNPSALVWLMLTAMPWLVKNGYERNIAP